MQSTKPSVCSSVYIEFPVCVGCSSNRGIYVALLCDFFEWTRSEFGSRSLVYHLLLTEQAKGVRSPHSHKHLSVHMVLCAHSFAVPHLLVGIIMWFIQLVLCLGWGVQRVETIIKSDIIPLKYTQNLHQWQQQCRCMTAQKRRRIVHYLHYKQNALLCNIKDVGSFGLWMCVLL